MAERTRLSESFDPISLTVELDELQRQLQALVRSPAAAGQQEAETHSADSNANLHYGSAGARADAAASGRAGPPSQASPMDRHGREMMPAEGRPSEDVRSERAHAPSESHSLRLDPDAASGRLHGADAADFNGRALGFAPQVGSEPGLAPEPVAPRVVAPNVGSPEVSRLRTSSDPYKRSTSAHEVDGPGRFGRERGDGIDEEGAEPAPEPAAEPSTPVAGPSASPPPTSGADDSASETSDHGSDAGDAPQSAGGDAPQSAGGDAPQEDGEPDPVAEPPVETDEPAGDPDSPADVAVPVTMVTGTSQNETLVGASGSDVIDGLGGHDQILGLEGDDVLIGGAGRDTLDGGAGDDVFVLEGDDRYEDRFIGGDGYDVVRGGAGDDVIRVRSFGPADGVELIDGGGGSNVLAGTSGNDQLDLSATELRGIAAIDAGAGHDTVIGSAGDDVLIGGAGRDTLDGGAGNDTLIFMEGHGRDRFDGGAGWTDVIRLDLPAEATPGVAWTIELSFGSVEAAGDNYLQLTQDSAGVLSLASGDEVIFQGLERIEW